MLEEESEGIRKMGQWNPSVCDNSYSAKLPLGPMRKFAGFSDSNKMYYNPRVTCAVTLPDDNDLLRSTPIGRWCYDALSGVLSISNHGDNQTAIHTLKFFCKLNEIFLQDAAAMLILIPERANHAIFRELAVFDTEAFKKFKDIMKYHLQLSKDPGDACWDSVLPPGVHQWHQATNNSIRATTTAVQNFDYKVDELADIIDTGLSKVVNHLERQQSHSERRIAASMMSVAQGLMRNIGTDFYKNGFESQSLTMTPASTDNGTSVTGTRSDEMETGEGTPMSSLDDDSSPTQPSLSLHKSFRMVKKHKTLADMWNEWHSTGPFADDIGGIKGRNKQLGAKWRKHLEAQHYSRGQSVSLTV
jgi:hypothetical protein